MNGIELKKRGIELTEKFLDRRGYEILDTGWGVEGDRLDIVAREGETLVFVTVSVREGADTGFKSIEEEYGRDRLEVAAARYLEKHGDEFVGKPVRFDHVSMMVLSSDRALVRHHINSLG